MSLDAIVGNLAEAIDRALVVYDNDFNVVAYSAHSGEVDHARRMAILTRRGSTRAREMMRSHGAASNVGPLVLPAEGDTPERVVYPVRHDGYVVGYLVYVEAGAAAPPTPEIRAELDRHAADLASLLLVRDLDRQEKRVRLRMLVSDLISDEAPRRSAAARAMVTEELVPAASRYTGIVLVPTSGAATASPQRRAAVEAALSALTRSANHLVTGAVTEGTAVAIMAGRGDPAGLSRHRTGVRIGIGASVTELSEVSASVHQARIAVRGCRFDPERYPDLARWDDLGLDRVLLQLPLDQLTIDDLPASVARLLAATGGPDLAATVAAYLDCAGDAQATAARLSIHRSSFYYRLDRAREVTGVDLHDGEIRRELHTGLRIAQLAGLGSWSAARH